MLTPQDHAILAFEHQHGTLSRWDKVTAIRDQLGISEARYHQRLNALAHVQEAVAAYPQALYRVQAIVEKNLAHRRESLGGRP